MKILIKLTGALHAEMLHDLTRKHPFAAERVGFVTARIGTLADDGRLILLTGYHSIPDCEYVNDPSVGARIGSDAITWAMQAAYHGRPRCEGIFHVHIHGHRGETGMSGVDSREIPPMIPGFQGVGRDAAHGIIILSLNHGSTWVWLPAQCEPVQADGMAVIGAPVQVFDHGRKK
jgi:hypothetical protein